jgi:hypothetical protein
MQGRKAGKEIRGDQYRIYGIQKAANRNKYVNLVLGVYSSLISFLQKKPLELDKALAMSEAEFARLITYE